MLRPDGTAAAGVQVRVDDGIQRWKFRGEGIAELPKPVTTAAAGTFSIPSIASGRSLLQIITRDLGPEELAVAFANPVVEATNDAPITVEIRPLDRIAAVHEK